MRYLFIFLLASCQTTCPQIPEEDEKVLVVPGETLRDFDDAKVEQAWVQEDYMQHHFYRKATTKDGNCRLSRTPITVKEGRMFMRLNGVTETCSGIQCEHCAFRDGGGCTCKNLGQGVCKHSISKNRDMLRAL